MATQTYEHVFITAGRYHEMGEPGGWTWHPAAQRYSRKVNTTPIPQDVVVLNATNAEVALRNDATPLNVMARDATGRFTTVPLRAKKFRLRAGAVQQRDVSRAVAWGHLKVVDA